MTNPRKSTASILSVLITGVALSGCAAEQAPSASAVQVFEAGHVVGQQRLPVTLVWQSQHCASEQPVTRPLRNDNEWLQIARPALSTRLGETAKALPVVDFQKYTYVLIALGTQPNPGHRLEMRNQTAEFNAGILTLPITFKTPETDKMYPQMLVAPCLVVSTPKVDPINEIRLR